MNIKFIICAFLGIALFSCTNDNEEELYPSLTDTISYVLDVEPIVNVNCYQCHGLTNPIQGGILLEGYTNISTYVLSPSSKFVCAIKWENCANMPLGRVQLPQTTIDVLEKWVLDGAPNN